MSDLSVKKIRELIDCLNKRTVEYDKGVPTVTDKEWDDSYFELKKLEKETGVIFPDSPTQSVYFQSVSKLKKIRHNHPMLSLEKTKSIDELKSFLGNNDYIAMAKMDGLTCSLRYVDGQLVSAETRGDGEIGEDIFHNAQIVRSIPKEIPIKEELVCDGEIICTQSDFKSFREEFKNPRNFAAGSIRLLSSKECAKRKLTFVLWEVIKGLNDLEKLSDKLDTLDKAGFTVVPFVFSEGTIEEQIEEVKKKVSEKGYPIDGLVFKFDNCAFGAAQGQTAHHFKNAMAFKFYDENGKSKLVNIEYGAGRLGSFTPIAVFEEVELDGSLVTKASLHNLSVMKKILGETPFVGQVVSVVKRNQIIPQIESAEKEVPEGATLLPIPKVCPVCGKDFVIDDSREADVLMCPNPNCNGKMLNKIDHFCGPNGLDMKGVSKKTIEKLMDYGWLTYISDLFKLKDRQEEWENKHGWGYLSVKKVIDGIEKARHSDLNKFIAALGIPLIGASVAKEIAKRERTYETFRKHIKEGYDFTQWDGFGEAMDIELKKFNYVEADKMYQKYLTIDEYCSEVISHSPFYGKTIAVTGSLKRFRSRKEFEKMIENLGAKMARTVTTNTTFLIANESEANTVKYQTAKRLKVPILTEDEFIEKMS